jgi:hypothetical protein
MASTFPGDTPSYDPFSTPITLAALQHTLRHRQMEEDIVALASKIGEDASAVSTSHDYKLSGVAGSDKAVSKAGTETLTNKTLTSPVLTTPTIADFANAAHDHSDAENGGLLANNSVIAAMLATDSVTAIKILADAITTVKILDGNVTLAKLEAAIQTKLGYLAAPDSGWVAPTFTNSWVNYGAGYNDAGYYKDAFGWVTLRGLVKNGTDGASIFTLPVGCRPEATMLMPIASADHYGRLDISTAGLVVPSATTTEPAWVCLDGVRFKAYQ